MHPQKNGSNHEKGAITVFLALVFMSIIIFAGTIIDIVRIAAADRKVQSVLNSSARSVLAGYDSELVGSYGIYGINAAADSINDEFYRYLSVNLAQHHEGIRLTDIKVDREDAEIQGMDSLIKDEIFKRQIQEHMKYRTPISITENLIEQLKNIKLDNRIEFAEGEKAVRDKARELRTKAEDVNSKIDVIKRKIGDLCAEKLEEIEDDLSEALTVSGLINSESGKGLLDEYTKSREYTNNKAREDGYKENLSQEFESIKENSENLNPKLQKCLSEVNKTLLMVKPLQKELRILYKELEDLEDDCCSDEVMDEIDKVRGEIEYIEQEIENEISKLKPKLKEFVPEGYSLKNETVRLIDNNAEELKKSIARIKENIKNTLFARIESDWLIAAEEFDNNSTIIGDSFALMDEKARYDSSMQEDEAEKINDAILKNIKKVSKAVEKAASAAAGKINIIEYVMDNFTFLTSKTKRNHYFGKGEVEYIISGTDTKEAYNGLRNTEYYVVTDVVLQIWALRFAIDFTDNFVRSSIVFPPQRLVFALIEGALDSSLDMFNMLNGEGVPICPKSFTSIRLKYSDHLKILLLMKPEEEILRKTRQLMQVNIKHLVDSETGQKRSSFKLGDYSTVISARVKAKVNLFFLPMLKVDRLMPKSFEGGRYIIRKQIYIGY